MSWRVQLSPLSVIPTWVRFLVADKQIVTQTGVMSMKNLVTIKNPREYDNVLTLDIETGSEGELLDVGLYGINFYAVYQDWQSLFEVVMQLQGNWRIPAHNGFGFDYITLVQWIVKHYKDYGLKDEDVTFLSSEYLLMAIILRTPQGKVTFIDTMRFFPGMSLEVIGQSMFGKGKRNIPDEYKSRMDEYKRLYRDLYYQYLRQDCELLFNIYTQFREKINEFVNIGELGLSSGSTAMRAFRRWLHDVDDEMFIFSAPKELLGAAEECLRGGLTLYIGDGVEVEVEKHKYLDTNVYDVISMYPSIQRYIPVPTGPMKQVDNIIIDADGHVRPGWYLCDFKQMKGRIPILFDMDRKIDHPVWEGTGLLSYFEIEFLKEFGKVTKVYDGVVFENYAYPFKDFMDQGLKMRLDAKAKQLHALALAIKIILNSLYGKFAQSPIIEQVAITSDMDWYASALEAVINSNGVEEIVEYFYDQDVVLYGTPSVSTSFSNRFIGGLITSLARLKLGLVYNTVYSIYCDTDSIFTQDTLDSRFIGKEAGDFELKSSNQELLCLGKKSYRLGDEVTWKGVPKKSIESKHIDEIARGEIVDIPYFRPTAFKTAMKMKKSNPNKFEERHRRIKASKSLKMQGLIDTKKSLLKPQTVQCFLDKFMEE